MSPSHQPFDERHAVKCELAAEVLRSSGALRLRVTGWSMLPSIWPGDTLILEHADRAGISEGDIVLFSRHRRLFAHRVLKISAQDSGFLHTRGDSMSRPDMPVSDRDLLGRVVMIERNGKCIVPRKALNVPGRVVASLVQSSEFPARVIVRMHDVRVHDFGRNAPIQTS